MFSSFLGVFKMSPASEVSESVVVKKRVNKAWLSKGFEYFVNFIWIKVTHFMQNTSNNLKGNLSKLNAVLQVFCNTII